MRYLSFKKEHNTMVMIKHEDAHNTEYINKTILKLWELYIVYLETERELGQVFIVYVYVLLSWLKMSVLPHGQGRMQVCLPRKSRVYIL